MHQKSHQTGNDVEITDISIRNSSMKGASLASDDGHSNSVSTNGTERKSQRKQLPKQNNYEKANGNNGTTTTTTTTTTPPYLSNEESSINNGNGYQNGSNSRRRNSANVWSPLLQSTNDCGGGGGGGVSVGGIGGLSERTEEALFGSVSNNNEWKDAEKINNFKNGLLHHNNRHNHNQHHSHLPQCNNNGSLMNGKKNGNGSIGITDKYDEQDPLTGLYKKKHQQSSIDSDESVFTESVSVTNSCGLFGCRPHWARNFASTHVFMVIFLLAYILQGMYMTYFVSVITTIEKLFQIKSRTTGLLLSASEMGQISTAMLLTYFAGRGHRPRWIACGMVLFSIAAFSCSLPHFIFGEQLMQSTNILNAKTTDLQRNGGKYLNSSMLVSSLNFLDDHNLCLDESNAKGMVSECNENRKLEQQSHSKITVIVLCIFFASLLSSGIGQTAVATLGIPYIDDNVASKQSPIYMAITIGVRILGPASGFIVGSMCTRWYVNFSDPGFDASDPRWIGAWWLGPVIIGSLMLIASIAMFSFPKQLSGRRIQPQSIANGANKEDVHHSAGTTAAVVVEETPKLRDFPKTVRRQLKNDILMFRTASCVFHLLPIAGLYTFLPKYLETQFHLAAYDANMIAAFCGILVMGFGIVVSGVVILKLKPTARSVAAWIAFTALFYSAGMVVLMFVGCNMSDFVGFPTGDSTASTQSLFEPICKLNCTCDAETFTPICGEDGKTYFSSCHAGCTMSGLRATDNRTVFTNCSCISDYSNSNRQYDAVSGYCDSSCKNFIYFILIFAICVFMHSTSEVGSMLVVMRCTHPKDKAMAMGVIQSAIGLFGNVPCPIIYGAVVDSACLVWKTVCGKHGACSLYDVDTFRHYFLGITASIMFLAFIMDLVVWNKAHRIDIAPHDDEKIKTECEKSPDTTV